MKLAEDSTPAKTAPIKVRISYSSTRSGDVAISISEGDEKNEVIASILPDKVLREIRAVAGSRR